MNNNYPKKNNRDVYRGGRDKKREKPAGADGTGRDKEPSPQREDLVIGRNAVREALKAGTPAECLYIERGEHKGPLTPIAAECIEKRIPVREVAPEKLDHLCGHGVHQGVILVIAARSYSSVDDILAKAEENGEQPFIIICDGLEDPHNLGAVIRSAEAAGAHGVIIPARRSAGLGYTVGKAAAGALEYIPVARVANLTSTIKQLQEKGVWVYAADMDGTPYYETDLSGSIALIVGNEGNGVSRLVRETADAVISIPMAGHINSLNASVAAGILMFETARTRAGHKS